MSRSDTLTQLCELPQERGGDEMARTFEAMVGVLLHDLCRDLTIAAATARGASARCHEARRRRADQAAAIHTVLDVCALIGIEIYSGPEWEDSLLEPPRRD